MDNKLEYKNLLPINEKETISNYFKKEEKPKMKKTWHFIKLKKFSQALLVLDSIKNYNFFSWYLARGRSLEGIKNYKEAIKCYKKINNKENQKAVLNIARCYQNWQRFSKAEATYVFALEKWPNDKALLQSFAYCYKAMEEWDKAIVTFKKIPNWQESSNLSTAIAECFQRKGFLNEANDLFTNSYKKEKNHKEFFKILISIYEDMNLFDDAWEVITQSLLPQYSNDPKILLNVAYFLIKMNKFKEALQILEEIPSSSENVKILFCKAFCYRKTLFFASAVKIYEDILNRYPSNIKVFFEFANCYQEMKQLKKAIQIYKNILKEFPYEKDVEISIAQCLEINGELQEAKEIYEKILNFHGYYKPALQGLASYHYKTGNFQEAKVFCDKIFSEDPNDKKTHLIMAKCHQDNGEYEQAIKIYQELLEKRFLDKDILLAIALCYQKQGFYDDAKKYYLNVLDYFPHSIEGAILYCDFLINLQNNKQVEPLVDIYLEKYPDTVSFHILKAECKRLHKGIEKAYNYLSNPAIQEFVYSPEIFLTLCKYSLMKGNRELAKKWQKYCVEIFSDYTKLILLIEEIMKLANLFREWHPPLSFTISEKIIFSLPSTVEDILTRLTYYRGEHYLIGNSVLNVLLPYLKKDLDINIVFTEPNFSQIIKKGFKNNYSLPFHWYGFLNNIQINYILPVHINNSYKDLFSREYTICTLLCDRNGKIYDFSGYGLFDAKNKILRTMKNPIECFAENSIRVADALNYMVQGFIPTSEIDSALKKWCWIPANKNETLIFYVVLRKYWHSFNLKEQTKCIDLLLNYNLLEQFFPHLKFNKKEDLIKIFKESMQHDKLQEPYVDVLAKKKFFSGKDNYSKIKILSREKKSSTVTTYPCEPSSSTQQQEENFNNVEKANNPPLNPFSRTFYPSNSTRKFLSKTFIAQSPFPLPESSEHSSLNNYYENNFSAGLTSVPIPSLVQPLMEKVPHIFAHPSQTHQQQGLNNYEDSPEEISVKNNNDNFKLEPQ